MPQRLQARLRPPGPHAEPAGGAQRDALSGAARLRRELHRWREAFFARTVLPAALEALFDHQPDLVIAVRDIDGRYVSLSEAGARRCGLRSRLDAVGRTARELLPRAIAERELCQDRRLLESGQAVIDSLDPTVFADGSAGWCLSTREPLRDARGELVGLICLAKDLVEASQTGLVDARFAAALDHIREHFREPLRVEALAGIAGLSEAQFERRMKRIFQVSATQYLIRLRISLAARLLAETELPIGTVAERAGFSDQSALSRQFRQVEGLAPRQYRGLHQARG